MPHSLVGPSLVSSAWGDFRRSWATLVLFIGAFKLLEAWLIAPAIGLLLTWLVARSGDAAVSNFDLLNALRSPLGIAYAIVVGASSAALLLCELGGVMLIAHRAERGRAGVSGTTLVLTIVGHAARVVRVSAAQLALLVVAISPFIALVALVYLLLLSRQDINYYLAARPPRYWIALAIGAAIGLAALGAASILLIRWSLALPIALFERRAAPAALRESAARVRGHRLRIAALSIGWLAGALLVGWLLLAGYQMLAGRVAHRYFDSPAMLALLFAGKGLLAAAASAIAAVGFALLIRRAYLTMNACRQSAGSQESLVIDSADAPPPTRRAAFVAAAVALFAAPAAIWLGVAQVDLSRSPVQATAHRGASKSAPENTLAALRSAIEAGADYAEIDVQLAADGAIVVIHDRDLKRVTGDPRLVSETTLAEIQRLDAGGWFGGAFAGERIPTLVEAIDLCRGRIKLNIELKQYRGDRRIVAALDRCLREEAFEGDCIVTSLDYRSLQELRRLNPRLRTGPIVTASVGDIARLEGELLSVGVGRANERLIEEAERTGKEVHVWTVNDERRMIRFISMGVDNILTDDPEMLVRVRAEWAELSDAERLAIASRALLGG